MRKLLSVGLIAVSVITLLTAQVASAHEGNGIVTIESAQDLPDRTDYVVRVTWENDGHPAADATVTATAIDPAGTPATPVTLTAIDDDGRYGASVPFGSPGTWAVRFSVVTPTSTLEVSRTVTAPTSTTQASTSTTATSTPVTAGDVDSDGNGGPVKALIGGGILVAIVGAAVLGFRRSTRRLK